MPTKLNTMGKQLTLFDTINEATNPACFLGAVSSSFCFDFIHKLSGEKLRIKKLFGNVALCECETTRIITEKPYLASNAAVCDIKNLIPIK